MKLNFNTVTQNQFFHSYRINQSAAVKNGKSGIAASQETRQDLAIISPQGKQGSLIDTLMKQKMSILEQKDSLISSAQKDGKSMESIRSQLEAYEKQLKDVDQQISQAMAKEMEKQAEKGKKDDGPKTRQEIENERLANVTDMSQGLERAEVAASVKRRVDGEARVLKSEIELDMAYAKGSEASKEAISQKEEKLSDLEQRSAELLSDFGEIAADTAEKAKEQNEAAASKEKEEDEATVHGENETDETAHSDEKE